MDSPIYRDTSRDRKGAGGLSTVTYSRFLAVAANVILENEIQSLE
jgi:hypothetical protein